MSEFPQPNADPPQGQTSLPGSDKLAEPTSRPPAKAAPWVWVPIRALAPRHRPRICQHLLALSASDRYLRFGYSASDEQIRKYADLLDFDRDELFGIVNRKLELVAVAHLASAAEPGEHPASEFGVSVRAGSRGRGFGHRLFEHAMLLARNRGVRRLFIHALSENTAMLRIARDSGAVIERDGADAQAWLELPPETIASRVGEFVEQRAAELDYRLKLNARDACEAEGLDAARSIRIEAGSVDDST